MLDVAVPEFQPEEAAAPDEVQVVGAGVDDAGGVDGAPPPPKENPLGLLPAPNTVVVLLPQVTMAVRYYIIICVNQQDLEKESYSASVRLWGVGSLGVHVGPQIGMNPKPILGLPFWKPIPFRYWSIPTNTKT